MPKANLWKSLISVLGPKTGIGPAVYARLSGRESTEKPPSLLKAATPDGELASSGMSSKLGFLCMYCGAAWHGTFPISCHLKEGLWTLVLRSPHHKIKQAQCRLSVQVTVSQFSRSAFESPGHKSHIFFGLSESSQGFEQWRTLKQKPMKAGNYL